MPSTIVAAQAKSSAFSSTTSKAMNYTGSVVMGQLLVCATVFVGTNSISNFSITDSQGNTWSRAAKQIGSNPPLRLVELWWAVAGSSGANSVTATWTETAGGVMFIDEFAVGGTGTIALAHGDSAEETSSSTTHKGTGTPRNLQDNDVAYVAGTTDGSTGGLTAGSAAGADSTGWTLTNDGTPMRQYRLPSGAVTGSEGTWRTGTARTAVSAMLVIRREAAPVEPEVLFAYSRLRRRGLNFGVN